jgi:hypothetical protein
LHHAASSLLDLQISHAQPSAALVQGGAAGSRLAGSTAPGSRPSWHVNVLLLEYLLHYVLDTSRLKVDGKLAVHTMVTKTIMRAKRLKSRVSAAQKAHSPASKTGVQQCALATQPPPLFSSSAAVTVSPPVAPVTPRQHQARSASRASQISSQPQRTHPQTHSCAPSSISILTTASPASPASPQTQTQSCQSTSTTSPSQPLPPVASTAAPQALPQTQSSSPISASTPPQPPNSSTPSLRTQSSWSTLASTPPRPPNPSTIGPQAQSHASNPGAATPQVSTPSLQVQPCPHTPASSQGQGQAPAAGTASPQKKTPLSALVSALWGVVRRNWKIFSGGCITVALAFVGVYLTGLYGNFTLKSTRWTLNNDFRDGCINDLDHNLTLAKECFAELAHPRMSAVNMKRHLGAVQDAYVDNAVYWTVAVCIPALTCIFYLVWMRTFARDRPRPVVSLVKMDFGKFGQGQHGNGNAMMTQTDETLSDLSHIRDHKVYDHLQQAEIVATPSAPGPDEDYFQAWRNKMKSPQEDMQAGDSDTESDHFHPERRTDSVKAGLKRESRESILKVPGFRTKHDTFADETEVYEVEFKPSGNRVKCQHIELEGPISQFQPTDGIQLDLWRVTEHSALSVLKFPFERGATAVSLVSQPPNHKANQAMDGSSQQNWYLYFTKRIMWARRLGLPTHRFVYLVVRDSGASQPGVGRSHLSSTSSHSNQHSTNQHSKTFFINTVGNTNGNTSSNTSHSVSRLRRVR